MFLFFMFFNILFGINEIKILKPTNELPLTNLTHNNEGIIMGRGIKVIEVGNLNLIYNLISKDNGYTFDTVGVYRHIPNPKNPTSNYHKTISFQNIFIFASDYTSLLITNDEGKSFDSLILSESKKFYACTYSFSQNDTNALLYSNSNMNQYGFPAFDLFYSTDGFKNYKVIDFDIFKDTFNILRDMKLENSNINLYSTLYINEDSSYFNIHSYDIENNSYNKDSILVDFHNFKHITTIDNNYYLYILKIKEIVKGGANIYSKLLVKLNKDGYEIIDTINVQKGGIEVFSYYDGTSIYSLTYGKLSIYNTKKNELDSLNFPISFFATNACAISFQEGYSWYNEETVKLMISSGSNCVFEIDLKAILSIEKKDTKSNIYPNPANKGNIVNIKLEELANKVEIFDLLGNKLQTIIENNFNYQINTEGLKSGIYLVVIEFENKKQITKFVVE